MPDLQRCSCTSVGDMKSSLRVLEIKSCPALEVFDLFQNGHNYKIEHKPWLPSLRKLIMCDCPHLHVQIPLPPLATFSQLLICRVSTFMTMEGPSMETFKINSRLLREPFGGMMALDDEILAFHNLKDIKYLEISSCRKLTSISFKGLSQLISLKSSKIVHCRKLFSSDDVPEQSHEEMITANDAALPSLESLYIEDSGITGKWLSLMLRHSPTLKELDLYGCPQLKQLTTEEKGKIQSNLISASEASSSGYVHGLVHIPLNLRKIQISGCLIFTSLEDLGEDAQEKGRCLLPQLLEQLVLIYYSRETLRPCFVGNLTCLKKLDLRYGSLDYLQLDSCTALEDLKICSCEWVVELEGMQSLRSLELSKNSRLKSLQLNSCTLLERLKIHDCWLLVALEGLRSLVNLKHLKILSCLALDSLTTLESYEPTDGVPSHRCELFPALESLEIDLSPHNTSFCKGRSHLVDLPAGLRGLPSLKTLKIKNCYRISGLSSLKGLPPSLEELVIDRCSVELSEGCRLLATSKLDVKVDGRYVD